VFCFKHKEIMAAINNESNLACDDDNNDFLIRFEQILSNYLKFSKILSFDILS